MERYERYAVLQEAIIQKEILRDHIETDRAWGRELVMKESSDGDTTLDTACENEASIEVVLALIEVGDREIVTKTLFYAYLHKYYDSDEVLLMFIQAGGEIISWELVHFIMMAKTTFRKQFQ